MKVHLTNSAYGALDYLAAPLGMLLVAAPLLHSLGIERYGIWILANATLGTGAVLASGFGDANIQSAAAALGRNQGGVLIRTVQTTLGIHIVLGGIVALAGWLLAPALTHLAIKSNTDLLRDTVWALRLTSAVIFIRAVETVFVSTQRAFCRYGAAVQVSITARLLSLAAATIVSSFTHSVFAVMISSLIISVIAVLIQRRQVTRLLDTNHLWPSFHPTTTKELLRFGVFSWIQAASGLLFGQADRIIAATVFGAAAAASYAFCVQIAMPVYGLAAAGLHFLFPLLATQYSARDVSGMRRSILSGLVANILFVALALSALLFFGKGFLRIWGGDAIASIGDRLLPAIAWGAALPALGVTGCYAMLAIGRPRIVGLINLAGGITMLTAIAVLIPHFGISGIANGRLAFGPVILLIYLPLFTYLSRVSQFLTPSAPLPAYEDA